MMLIKCCRIIAKIAQGRMGKSPQKNGLKKAKKRTALCIVRALESRMDLDSKGENAYTQVVFNTIQQRIL